MFIPKVLINEDYNQDLGRSYMITDEIKGKDITEKGHNVETILHEAGKQLALANSIPIKNFGWMEKESPNCTELVGECSTYKQFAMNDERVTAMTNDLVSSNVISTHLKKKYLDYYYKQKPSFKCTQAYLAHGDFSTDHIYQLDGKYAGIIDWGDIRATSVYHDLGHFYTYSPNIFEFLLKGFLSVNKLQEDYMKNIELVAIQFAIGKLWWVSKNLPEKLDKKKHPTIVLMEKVLL